MKTRFLILLPLLVGTQVRAYASQSASPGIQQILSAAVVNSERLAASHSSEKLAELKISLVNTGYLPTVQAEAIDSKGFAGSTGQLGVGGLMGSPYRSGWGYGLVVTQPIYDFGKTSRSNESAKADFEAQKSLTTLTKIDVMRGALDLYLECSLAETQRVDWKEIQDLAALSEREVNSYVRTGQRSVVESLLVRTQKDEAIRSGLSVETKLKLIRQRLAVVTGLPFEQIQCSNVQGLDDGINNSAAKDKLTSATNPQLNAARLQLSAAQLKVTEARGGYLPKIVALGSVGQVEDTRVVKQDNYAVGVSLIVPLFDGNKTNLDVERAQADVEVRAHQLKATEQTVSETDLQLDQAIAIAQVEAEHIKTEVQDSERAFKESKVRYFAKQGNLADLRESIRNLTKARFEFARIQTQSKRSKWLKAIYDGEL